ncbi:MAG TPA: aminopeptidase P N-terminal domain-containing protein, partial [Anaeromyxobacteraceae bacterium]|nr:aminopeptidase P N-terminal domain-containing protein [Anaeromyxobacteraceae bacterium]
MHFDAKVHAARRDRIYEAMERQGGGVMVLPAAEEKHRNAENEYPFRQDSDYAWVVGLDEPSGGAVLVARGGERKLVLFVRPKDPEKEIWTGRRVGVEGAKARYGAAEAYPVDELDAKLPELLNGAPALWYKVGQGAAWDGRIARVLNELRQGGRLNRRAPAAIFEPGG